LGAESTYFRHVASGLSPICGAHTQAAVPGVVTERKPAGHERRSSGATDDTMWTHSEREMREGQVVANGIEFFFLEEGSGPLLLLLHGYPDIAWTWEHQMAPFAAAGRRVVAPFLRGHPPTEIPARGYYDRATLALDLKALIEVLAPDGRADVVGQDWGAAMTYGFLAAFPDLVRRAVVMAIPHAGAVQESLVEPEQIHRAFHWWFFQLPTLPEQAIPANDFAFISYLWDYWSPGHAEHAHVQRIKSML